MFRLKSKIFVLFFVLFFLIAGSWFILESDRISEEEFKNKELPKSELEIKKEITEIITPVITDTPPPPAIQIDIPFEVPFTSQAPFANWGDPVFQNGCEEASILMAMRWVQRKSLAKKEAYDEIAAISNFEQKKYGEFRDRSAKDVTQLIKDYYGYENIEYKEEIDAEDIKLELALGNLVIVPLNGQKLYNPFYTAPGPVEHMLIVIGYDARKKEFITNDPGTAHGEKYRYKEKILEAALQDYPTGFREPIIKIIKAMIVVKPR